MHRKIYLILLSTFYFLLSTAPLARGAVSTSVIVPPSPSNYSISITNSPTQSIYPENSTITYTITYGNNFNISLPLTITANWTDGTISGQSSPSVDVADYVVGSATNGYGGTPPVVDTQNQTITWDISAFPGNTSGQTVSFQLETNSNYTGPLSVDWDTSAFLSTTGMTTPPESVTLTYQYSGIPTPTPSPVPQNNNSSSPSNSNPSVPPLPLVIDYAKLQNITQNSATVLISASQQIVANLSYGTSPQNLNKNVSSFSLSRQTLLTIPNLTADTVYYFKVSGEDSLGNQATSDIFTFRTASGPSISKIELTSFIAIANNIIVSKPSSNPGQNSTLLPRLTDFNFQFSLAAKSKVKKVSALIWDPKIGTTWGQTIVTQLQNGNFYGSFKTPTNPGNYQILIEIIDGNNNLTTQKISDLIVSSNFSVFSKSSNSPLEGARVLIYYLNPQTNKFSVIPQISISILNPSFTDRNGEINLVLAQGRYQAQISQIGFKDKTVQFDLGPNQGYPKIYMESKKIVFADILTYVQRSLDDVFVKSTISYVDTLTGSTRLFNVISKFSLMLLIGITFFSLFLRIKIHPKLSPKSAKDRIFVALFKDIARFISMSFEILIILSLLFEMLSINSFGLTRTLPYLVVSIINLSIWTVYIRKGKSILPRP